MQEHKVLNVYGPIIGSKVKNITRIKKSIPQYHFKVKKKINLRLEFKKINKNTESRS